MLFLFLFLSSETIFVSANASDDGICSWTSPCSFEKAQNYIEDYKFIYIVDHDINDPNILKSVSNFLSFAISKNCIISGTDTLIDGKDFYLNDLAFIHSEKGDEAKILQISFINFNCTILSIKSFSKFSFSQCQFISNEMNEGLGLIAASHTSLKIRHCRFTSNYINGANCIEASQSQVYLKSLDMENNYIRDSYHHYFYFINSIIECRNLILSNFYAPTSSIFSCDYRTYFTFVDTKFKYNLAEQLFSCDGIINFQFHSTNFVGNVGQIMKATSFDPIINFKYCEIRNNTAPNDLSMFQLNGGQFKVDDPVVIISNQGGSFIDFNNYSSLFSLNLATVNLNILSDGFLKNVNEGQIHVVSSVFCLNILGNFLFRSSHALMLVHSSHFLNNVGKLIFIHQGVFSSIYSVFNSTSQMPIIVINESDYAKSEIASSQFVTNSNDYMIKTESSNLMISYTKFSQAKNEAIAPDVICKRCMFRQYQKGVFQVNTIAVAAFALAFVLAIIVVDGINFCKSII